MEVLEKDVKTTRREVTLAIADLDLKLVVELGMCSVV